MPRELEWLCVGIALLGLASLLAYARELQPATKSIDQLTAQDTGSWISVQGRIASLRQTNGHLFLSVCMNSCVAGFIPKNLAQELNQSMDVRLLKPGTFIRMQGKLEEYGGELELVAFQKHSLEVLKP